MSYQILASKSAGTLAKNSTDPVETYTLAHQLEAEGYDVVIKTTAGLSLSVAEFWQAISTGRQV